ncbi:SP_1767 family glycosyltransferase [Limosilactobacillus walteri]|uniref:SP_1767 family glycosyltransferase n=1 Tax=Limosilactobacillus walteri TaxID=2268022 RepID=UPI00177A9650|nr:SP_1767 family glycosyltransferase [Limosilactobacillus walteri]
MEQRCSVARFGDGEISLLNGVNQVFQDADYTLRQRLDEILKMGSRPELLVCLSDVFHGLDMLVDSAHDWWQGHLATFNQYYQEIGEIGNYYGNTMVTRPYMDFKDRSSAGEIFDRLKEIWRGRDLLIVEGYYTRSGVGNDLYSTASSVRRIICPSKNAWEKYYEIEKMIKLYGQNCLVLVMLGMTATVIAADLAEYTQVIDLGHLDPEYEWYKIKAKTRVPIRGKHTAEMNYDVGIEDIDNQKYRSEIIAKIGVE